MATTSAHDQPVDVRCGKGFLKGSATVRYGRINEHSILGWTHMDYVIQAGADNGEHTVKQVKAQQSPIFESLHRWCLVAVATGATLRVGFKRCEQFMEIE